MHPAAPEFVNYLSEFDYSILLIDDVGRCNQSVFNALMELIYKGKNDGRYT
jgi:ATP-dependent Clp protease ATP-binding subunit ClpA